MRDEIKAGLLGALIPVVLGAIAAAVYIGSLGANVDNLKTKVGGLGDKLNAHVQKREPGHVDDPRPTTGAADAFQPGELRTFTNAGRWGQWSDVVYCPPGEYVCGLQQKVESYQRRGDDTAMNAIGFYCCPLDPGGDG